MRECHAWPCGRAALTADRRYEHPIKRLCLRLSFCAPYPPFGTRFRPVRQFTRPTQNRYSASLLRAGVAVPPSTLTLGLKVVQDAGGAVDHPADAVAVEDDAPVGAHGMSGIGGPFRAALGQGGLQAVGLFLALYFEAEGGVMADAGLLAHRPRHVRRHQPVVGDDR